MESLTYKVYNIKIAKRRMPDISYQYVIRRYRDQYLVACNACFFSKYAK